MTNDECRHEEQVLEALATGAWNPELEAHEQDCPECAELAEIDRALQADARVAAGYSDPPDASLIWRRFELESGHLRARDATLPIRLLEKLAFGIALLAATYGLVHLAPSVGSWLFSTGSSLSDSFSLASGRLGAPALLLLSVTGLLGILVHGLYAQWSEA